ncbi:MAG: class I SAM-dependent methyltransferase [Rhodospirillum sp.]|nr:class I SAM-dependent methyltransferase [Rhodospirillum sp.]MCF8489101.1 class I SAM-dependent methyltransferase [Rhodospirillum sp.]MCF8498891.1 class I SAM-dependent methyltransferase [Rhodospirillum sp.]
MTSTHSLFVCPVCEGSRFHGLYEVSDTNQNVPGKWDIVQCQDCGTGWLSPFPEQAEIEGFYREQFYTKDGKRFNGWMEVLRKYLARLRGKHLSKLMPGRGHLLDLGAGAGHFAEAMGAEGWTALSADLYSGLGCEHCHMEDDRIITDFPDESFDAVTLWYVIEHLRNPDAAIEEARRLLKPGGILLLAQQNFASVQAKRFGPNWLFLDPPRHIFQFTPNGLKQSAVGKGFVCVSEVHSSLEMGPFTILQSTLNAIIGNKNYLFRYLKSRNLMNTERPPVWAVLSSFILCIPLVPLSILAYYYLLYLKSGDVFELYLRKL